MQKIKKTLKPQGALKGPKRPIRGRKRPPSGPKTSKFDGKMVPKSEFLGFRDDRLSKKHIVLKLHPCIETLNSRNSSSFRDSFWSRTL